MNAIVRKDSIEELCGHRQAALDFYAQAVEALILAKAAHARACVGLNYVSGFQGRDLEYITDNGARFKNDMRKTVDQDMWRALLANTGLASLMDAKERKLFEESIAKDPPEITADTVFATLTRLASDGPTIFRRGLVDAFRSLCSEYKSNNGFKIGPRMVLKWAADVNIYRHDNGSVAVYAHVGSNAEQTLRDVDRVLHILDGKPAPDNMQGICQAAREAIRRDNPDDWVAETDYLRVKFHRNRNAHVWMKRDDLRALANKLIAEHYGNALGAGTDVSEHRRGHVYA